MHEILDSKDHGKIISEVAQFRSKLNTVVGLGGFTVGVSCLGTRHPSLYAAIGAVIFLSLQSHVFQYFPKDIIALRELVKENPNDKDAKSELDKCERIFSFKSVFESNLPYIVGYLFYCFVISLEPVTALVYKGFHWFY